MKKILLKDIWPIDEVQDHKVHFARWNGEDQPLDEWVRDPTAWVGWQRYRPHPDKDDFNRDYIFSLMSFYHETDVWLFGGVFRVKERHKDRYEVELTERGGQFIGRLKLRFHYVARNPRPNFEGSYDEFEVSEVLAEPYFGRTFPGYERVHIDFRELESLAKIDRPDWKAALANVNGVYLITDESTGKRYVGSASGEQGLWGRWKTYIETGHGGNQGIKEATGDNSQEYARRHFVFTLLEFFAFRTPEEVVRGRETFWKQVLLTRGKYGLNEN